MWGYCQAKDTWISQNRLQLLWTSLQPGWCSLPGHRRSHWPCPPPSSPQTYSPYPGEQTHIHTLALNQFNGICTCRSDNQSSLPRFSKPKMEQICCASWMFYSSTQLNSELGLYLSFGLNSYSRADFWTNWNFILGDTKKSMNSISFSSLCYILLWSHPLQRMHTSGFISYAGVTRRDGGH